MTHGPFRALVLAAIVAASALLATAARAADPVGPPFGKSRAVAEIADVDGEADTDDYVGPLLAGDTLRVTVSASGKSKLQPAVQILDPTGADRTPAVTAKKGGRVVATETLTADRTGSWTVRVSGTGGTQGAYAAAFDLRGVPKFGTKKGTLGDGGPRTAVHTFEVTPGSLVSLSLRPLAKKGEVSLANANTPDGAADASFLAAAKVRKGVTTIRNHDVGARTGTYTLVVALDDEAESGTYRLDVVVRPGGRATGSRKFKGPEARIVAQAAPQRVASGFEATFAGHDLSADPAVRVLVGGAEAEVTAVAADGTSVTVIVPQLAAPAVLDVTVVGPDGQAFTRAGLAKLIEIPSVVDVRDAQDRSIREAPVAGGDAIQIVGSGLDEFTTVTFGTTEATVTGVPGPGRLAVDSPVMTRSIVKVRVADEFGRSSTSSFSFLFPHHGWGEGDGGRLPLPGATDDFAAARAVVGDLDRDGRRDDVAIVSPIRSADEGFGRHGTRESSTRVLAEQPDRSFADRTTPRIPAAFSAAVPFDADDWNAHAIALGDVDGVRGDDIVLAGFGETYFDGRGNDQLYGGVRSAAGTRVLRADAAGAFGLAVAEQGLPQARRPDLTARDGNGATRPLLGPYAPQRGDPSALAIGDIDDDGRLDVVVARREHGIRRLRQDPTNVDFTADPPEIPTADADAFVASPYASYAYVAGTEILENRLDTDGTFTYVTELRMPLSFGGAPTGYQGPLSPGWHGDDVALADLDDDGDLDLVVAWHDPTTVSVFGLKSHLDSAWAGVDPPVSLDTPRVATRILLNDGAGHFTDATATWLPAGAGAEYWQAHRIAVRDVTGDGKPDLVLLHRDGVAAWQTTALQTVVVTPTAQTASPGDVAAAETDVYSFDVSAPGRFVVEVALGSLEDSVLTLHGPDSETTLLATDDDGGAGQGSRIVRDLTAGRWYAKVRAFGAAQTGTYTLTARGRPDGVPAVTRTRSALRVLRNDFPAPRFVDVTATAVPSPSADDLRGGGLCVDDADGDGTVDILVATTEALTGSGGGPARSLRFLRGGAGPVFTLAQDLLPAPDLDSGQAEDVVLLPSPGGHVQRSIVLVGRPAPTASQDARRLRLLDWHR